jgi:hypothetical protein
MTTSEFATEAYLRWGKTESYKESQRRLTSYSPEDIEQAQAEMAEATEQVKRAFNCGLPPESKEAMAGAEAHRQSISRWWYECSYEMHKNLGDMYLADPRFSAHYEERAVGLTQYMRDAIWANAQNK